jgi:hypothetical protein
VRSYLRAAVLAANTATVDLDPGAVPLLWELIADVRARFRRTAVSEFRTDGAFFQQSMIDLFCSTKRAKSVAQQRATWAEDPV